MRSMTVSLAELICVKIISFQLPADETKLKMMQEVSENFEVNVIIHGGFAFFWSLIHHDGSIPYMNY